MGFKEGIRKFGAAWINTFMESEVVRNGRLVDVDQRKTERGTTYFLATYYDHETRQRYKIRVDKEKYDKLDVGREYRLVIYRGETLGYLIVCEPTETREPLYILADGKSIILFEKLENYPEER